MTDPTEPTAEPALEFIHTATYSPEDNKLRIYPACRLPKPEYEAIKAAGFRWAPKQELFVCPAWSPAAEDAALALCGEIDDEDQPAAERAAARAERFDGYRERRTGEAVGRADRYDAGPVIHAGHSAARVERQAARHDRRADRACTQWSKAEYWQRRTAGVISHALYQERADVRHRRIKGLEADLRRYEADNTPSKVYDGVEYVRKYMGEDAVAKGHDCIGIFGQGRGAMPRSYRKADGPPQHNLRGTAHLGMRIAYERQMLAAQGGTKADADMEVGGFIDGNQIERLTKDRAGRVNKVLLHSGTNGNALLRWHAAERIKGAYRPPTDEERQAFQAKRKALAATKPKDPPLINLSAEDAQALQTYWNAKAAKSLTKRCKDSYPAEYLTKQVAEVEAVKPAGLPQAYYSDLAKGSYGSCRTVDVSADWTDVTRMHGQAVAFRVRTADPGSTGNYYAARRVVHLTDKPCTHLPARIEAPTPTSQPQEANA